MRRTVEEPHAGVVRVHAEGDRVHGRHLDGVAAHRVRLALVQRRVQLRVVGRVVLRAPDELHLVPVQVAVGCVMAMSASSLFLSFPLSYPFYI